MIKNLPKLIFCIGICEIVGLAGTLFTLSSIPTWYAALNKPSFSPPNYLFGPVWTTLYALMGISLYIILKNKTSKKSIDNQLLIFILQLVLNGIWTPIFFGLKNPGLGLIVIIAMWITIVLTIKSFYSVSKVAAYLLIPYLLWVSFATVLNFSIWKLN